MINEKLALVPSCPGCYLMKNSEGYIIYVGKSKNLKNRLSSYFKSSHTGKTKMLVSEIADFEYIITNTEIERPSKPATVKKPAAKKPTIKKPAAAK